MGLNTAMGGGVDRRVLLCRIRGDVGSARPAWFLFTLRQVENVLTGGEVMSVPFAEAHLTGIAAWGRQVLPVISLEACLGIQDRRNAPETRLPARRHVMLRSGPMVRRGLFEAGGGVIITALPETAMPVAPPAWIGRPELTRGVYEHPDQGYLILADIGKILDGDF